MDTEKRKTQDSRNYTTENHQVTEEDRKGGRKNKLQKSKKQQDDESKAPTNSDL